MTLFFRAGVGASHQSLECHCRSIPSSLWMHSKRCIGGKILARTPGCQRSEQKCLVCAVPTPPLPPPPPPPHLCDIACQQEGAYDNEKGSNQKQHCSKHNGLIWDLGSAFLKCLPQRIPLINWISLHQERRKIPAIC